MTGIRDQLRSLTVSLLSHRCKHDARGAVREVVGAGTGQRQHCIDGLVCSAVAPKYVVEALDTVIE